jgi:nucleotide-binding universal stress UspA family protein
MSLFGVQIIVELNPQAYLYSRTSTEQIMKKIIVPTDFSDGAFNALLHALHLAKIMGSSITIVHAYSMPPTGSAVMVDITDVLKKNADEELEKLKTRVDSLQMSSGITIQYIAKHGTVVDVVNRLSKSQDADFVVMGTQGASGITEKWLGSNTSAAARNVDIPLIAIPAELPYKSFEKILFATDMKVMENPVPMEFVAKLSERTLAKVKFMHIRKPGEEEDDAAVEKYKAQVRAIFDKSDPDFAFLFESDIEEGIADAIAYEQPDLAVVVRHEYGFFEGLFHSSVSQHVINTSAIPILIIKG